MCKLNFVFFTIYLGACWGRTKVSFDPESPRPCPYLLIGVFTLATRVMTSVEKGAVINEMCLYCHQKQDGPSDSSLEYAKQDRAQIRTCSPKWNYLHLSLQITLKLISTQFRGCLSVLAFHVGCHGEMTSKSFYLSCTLSLSDRVVLKSTRWRKRQVGLNECIFPL